MENEKIDAADYCDNPYGYVRQDDAVCSKINAWVVHNIQSVQEKLCIFFLIHCNPIAA